jgi:hypothetical protein
MEYGNVEFFDARTAPQPKPKHDKSALREWLADAMVRMKVGQAFIVPGTTDSMMRGARALCARNAVADVLKISMYKSHRYNVFATDAGVVVTRLA